MKKKLLIVNNDLKCGGIQKALLNLLNEIKSEYDVTLLLFKRVGSFANNVPKEVVVCEVKSTFKYLGMSQAEAQNNIFDYIGRSFFAIITKMLGIHISIKLMLLTQKKIGYFDYAISFLHGSQPKTFYGGCVEFVLKKVNSPVKIGYIHCDYFAEGINTIYNKKLYAGFDRIAAVSQACSVKLITALPEIRKRVYCVKNCINYNEILNLANDKPIEYDSSFINIITVARLGREKGIERAIDAVSECLLLGYKIRYHIVGHGVERKRLENLALNKNALNNIFFYGNQNNPYRFMKNADLFLLPSYHEAAPMVFEEAKCLGIPILSTETTSTKEMVVDCNAGWVCDNSAEGIQKKLEYISDNPDILKEVKSDLKNRKFDNVLPLKQFMLMLEERSISH